MEGMTDEEMARMLSEELNGGRRQRRAAAPEPKKEKKKPVEGAPKRPSVFSKPCGLAPLLADFVGAQTMARAEVVKVIYAYVKEHNLQNPADGREIFFDDRLQAVFKGRKKTTYFKMQKYLAPLMWYLEAESSSGAGAGGGKGVKKKKKGGEGEGEEDEDGDEEGPAKKRAKKEARAAKTAKKEAKAAKKEAKKQREEEEGEEDEDEDEEGGEEEELEGGDDPVGDRNLAHLVSGILAEADLNELTVKKVMAALEQELALEKGELRERKDFVKSRIDIFLSS